MSRMGDLAIDHLNALAELNALHYLNDGDDTVAFETPFAANEWSRIMKGYKDAIRTCTCGNYNSHQPIG